MENITSVTLARSRGIADVDEPNFGTSRSVLVAISVGSNKHWIKRHPYRLR